MRAARRTVKDAIKGLRCRAASRSGTARSTSPTSTRSTNTTTPRQTSTTCHSRRSFMTTCRPTFRMAGNIWRSTRTAGSTSPFGPPCNICLPPTSTAQIRHIDPANGLAEIVALGVRNSVGGDVDPRTGDYWFTENARDWLGDDVPSDKLNHISQHRRGFRLSVLPPGRHTGSEIRHGAQVLGIRSAGAQARRTHGAARHEVLHREPIPGGL